LQSDTADPMNKKLKAATELVELQSYFYATLQGDLEVRFLF
jgi:hypothetical protein